MVVEEPSMRPRNEGAVEESITGKLRTMSERSTLLLPRCANVDTIFRPVLALVAYQPGTAKHQRRGDYEFWTV